PADVAAAPDARPRPAGRRAPELRTGAAPPSADRKRLRRRKSEGQSLHARLIPARGVRGAGPGEPVHRARSRAEVRANAGSTPAPEPAARRWSWPTLMERTGTVVACDVRSYKLDDLRIRARRAGFPNIRTCEWDGKPYQGKQAARFDGVLVDAPCSCSGVWRRNPDGRWTLKPEDVEEAAALQQRILEAASTAVRSGGLLIYATCSLFPRENGGVVDAFLASHEEFALEPFEHPLTGEPCGGMLQVRSFDGDCDSMFVARLRRKEAES
ncbi:MAG TPA: hypothetical protein DD673_16540, partial [Lentisphaeria bacterium]|nr:hypothetical protein [Lentisphaeria bacterium]